MCRHKDRFKLAFEAVRAAGLCGPSPSLQSFLGFLGKICTWEEQDGSLLIERCLIELSTHNHVVPQSQSDRCSYAKVEFEQAELRSHVLPLARRPGAGVTELSGADGTRQVGRRYDLV